MVSVSPTSYPVPPSEIVTPVIWPVTVAVIVAPAAVVAVMVSPIVKDVVDLFVKINSIIGIVPNLRVEMDETNAVASEVIPVIVRPLKFK